MSARGSAAVARERVSVSQSDFPAVSLQKAAAVSQCLWDNFAGKSAPPHEVAIASGMSPSSSNWRVLSNAAFAYGIVTAGWNAKEMALTDLGRRMVAPLEEGAEFIARLEAAVRPRIFKEFFTRYDTAKFPKDEVAKNVLVSLGLPKDRSDVGIELLKANGRYAGLIREIKSGLFVSLKPTAPLRVSPEDQSEDIPDAVELGEIPPRKLKTASEDGEIEPPKRLPAVGRVFITHGKNKKILEQIKEIVRYGKHEPIVAVEHETVSKPVPDKVMEDMRSCQAAVIHIAQDGVLADQNGTLVPQINGNVLIEIGAAMALYGRKFILLVEDGIQLPSNLQGLYECRYTGDSLDGFATMKLLKAFNDFGA
jgi:hypothetical protein